MSTDHINLKDKVLSNAKFLLSEKVLRLGGNFILSIFIANSLGVIEYGNYALMLGFVYIFLPIIDFGTTEYIIKNLSTNKNIPTILGTSLKFRLSTSILMIFISTSSFYFLVNDDSRLFLNISIFSISFIFRSFDVIIFLFQARLKNDIIAKVNNIVFIILLIGKIWGVLTKQGITFFVITSAFENILLSFLYLYVLKKEKIWFSFKPNKDFQLTPYLGKGFFILIATLMTAFHMRIDLIFIEKLLTDTELGQYSLAARFLQASIFIPETIAIIGYPILIAEQTKKQSFEKYFTISAFITLATTAILYIIAISPLKLFLSSEYSNSFEILKALSFLTIPIFFNIICLRVFILFSDTSFLIRQNLFILILNIVLNAWLTPIYRTNGIIIATFSSYFISFVTMAYFSKKFREYLFAFFVPKLNRILK